VAYKIVCKGVILVDNIDVQEHLQQTASKVWINVRERPCMAANKAVTVLGDRK